MFSKDTEIPRTQKDDELERALRKLEKAKDKFDGAHALLTEFVEDFKRIHR